MSASSSAPVSSPPVAPPQPQQLKFPCATPEEAQKSIAAIRNIISTIDGDHAKNIRGFLDCETELQARLIAMLSPPQPGADASSASNLGASISDGLPSSSASSSSTASGKRPRTGPQIEEMEI